MRLAILIFVVFFGGADAVQTLSALQGSFTSPNYPNEYANNLDNEWVIRVREGHHVKLRFTSFELEDSYEEGQGPCIYDYVMITEGTHTIGRFCGNPTEYPWDAPRPNEYFYSNGNEMHLRFVTDYSNGDISPVGFEAHYVEEDNDECAEQRRKASSMLEDWDEYEYCNHYCQNVPGSFYCTCRHGFRLHENMKTCIAVDNCENQVLEDDHGVIKSPDYPQPYAKLSHCTWDIQVRRGLSVTLQFDNEFGVEEHVDEGCVYDILTITANGVTKRPYCGQTAPEAGAVMDMNTKDVRIEFKTDLAIEDKGFNITYNTIRIRCETSLTDPANGRILNPKAYYEFEDKVNFKCNIGYHLRGDPNLTCQWDGTWDHVQPHCEIKTCERPDHLRVSYSHIVEHILDFDSIEKFDYDTELNVECNDWYQLTAGATKWRCNDTEEWAKVGEPIAQNAPFQYPVCRPTCGYKGDEPPPPNPLLRIFAPQDEDGDALHETAPHEWPWVVFLNFGIEKNLQATQAICGGSLISARYVLTAAHCLTFGGDHTDKRDADKVHVWLGVHDRDDNPLTVTYSSVENVALHHKYYTPTDRNFDVGLIRLTKTITMNNEMRPICLPSAEHFNMIQPNENGTVVGWGLFDDESNAAKILLKGTFPVVSTDDCWRSFVNKSAELGTSLGNLQLTNNMFCAGYEEDGFTTCRGDSGGAFMMKDGNQTYALGLVSFGLSVRCGRLITYTVYARLNEDIVNWINRETNNLEET